MWCSHAVPADAFPGIILGGLWGAAGGSWADWETEWETGGTGERLLHHRQPHRNGRSLAGGALWWSTAGWWCWWCSPPSPSPATPPTAGSASHRCSVLHCVLLWACSVQTKYGPVRGSTRQPTAGQKDVLYWLLHCTAQVCNPWQSSEEFPSPPRLWATSGSCRPSPCRPGR